MHVYVVIDDGCVYLIVRAMRIIRTIIDRLYDVVHEAHTHSGVAATLVDGNHTLTCVVCVCMKELIYVVDT